MEMTARITRQLVLVSLLMLLVPLVLFPDRLGTPLAKASLLHAVGELVYYGIVALLLVPGVTFLRVIQAAGMCFIYRLVLGAVFGFLAAASYSMSVKASLTLGLSGYLPAILLHIAIAPFALRPLAVQLGEPAERRRRPYPSTTPGRSETGGSGTVVHTGYAIGSATDTHAAPATGVRLTVKPVDAPMASGASESNGFDRAAHYVSEDGSVQAALIVDDEGLLLGRFCRGSLVPEDWAPLALLLESATCAVLRRAVIGSAEKVDIEADRSRIVVARANGCRLMVIADRQASDVLKIRIHQAVEMINKYVEQRYGAAPVPNAEMTYVSSAQ
ncbi:MAG: hypothetical protein AB1744_01990 [Candidatus Zixiibacteriota bacterium]